jgi:hypothetical protein
LLLSRKDGGGVRSAPALLSAILAVLLLVSSQGVRAAVPTTSGVTQTIGNTLVSGTTSYNVHYSYPSVAQVGTNLTISLALHVNAFTGRIEYITDYSLEAQVFIGTQELNQTVFGPAGLNSSSFVYPGATWGPNNFTFPLTEANTGLTKGQSDNATLEITLRDTTYIGVPFNQYLTEPAMQASGGGFLVQDAVASSTTGSSSSSHSSGQTTLSYALLVAGVIFVVAGVIFVVAAAVIPRSPRPATSDQR